MRSLYWDHRGHGYSVGIAVHSGFSGLKAGAQMPVHIKGQCSLTFKPMDTFRVANPPTGMLLGDRNQLI